MTICIEKKISNPVLVDLVINELYRIGVEDFIVCPGGRNTPFVEKLVKDDKKLYFWPEERSAGFFALGKAKLTKKPVAICTTSGTAAGELLVVAMEAYYAQVPLVLITADRPKRFRGSGSPQTAEQRHLFGRYAVYEQDLEFDDGFDLSRWKQNGSAHINVCLEEPNTKVSHNKTFTRQDSKSISCTQALNNFIIKNRYPLVVVGSIPIDAKMQVVQFLKKYNAPVYLEAISHLRNELSLNALKLYRSSDLWKEAGGAGYPIDGVLRIGSVPTIRLWRDLEDKQDEIDVCSISEEDFSGLSWGSVHQTKLRSFFSAFEIQNANNQDKDQWIASDRKYKNKLTEILHAFPKSEASLIHQLSKQIKNDSMVYLGNSLPIREWDGYASDDPQNISVYANRGLNGIDGQLSTFLGMCEKNKNNWGVFGDLTTIYDLAAPWILKAMQDIPVNIVVVNNGGGKIFDRMFALEQIQNRHDIQFESFAKLWNMSYIQCHNIIGKIPLKGHRLIEIIPDCLDTEKFWQSVEKI